ncbi:hypothetical protein DRW48_13445 [Paracoccus suum]|uniref:Uncharacterized protein n=1 Tax=Paracoccus suum TaxID=2259340 RepID=A0A344PME6_9RHOB|nr:hypothetical protein [Paracoccus suum]AXC50551.1 hypothetical protein DRW48_13445 [Paracoccus suum]
MSLAHIPRRFWSGARLFALATSGLILVIFIAANWHLVAISLASHPDCALALPQDIAGPLAAAKPSC